MKFLIAVLSSVIFINCFISVVKPLEVKYSQNNGYSRMVLNDHIDKKFVLGKFNYRNDSTFVMVDSRFTIKDIYLKREVSDAFITMANAAKLDSVDLKIVSGTRSFYEQKAIWERKWKKYDTLKKASRAKKILEYSSMPSTSRHHWGTDIDLNSLNNSYFNTGKGKATYNWLKTHANRFGFYQVYTNKTNGRTGYNEEKWHWSYLPLSSKYLSYYNDNVKVTDISGFKGSEIAEQLEIIENYVNGISKKAKRYN